MSSKLIDVTDIDEWEYLTEECEVVEDENITDRSRWQIYYEMVVKDGDKFWRLNWSVGATEYQEMAWEDETHTKIEVFPKEVTTIIYTENPN